MSRFTQKQQFKRLAEIAKARRTGVDPPKRRKSGGIATKPTVECPDVVEDKVQRECIRWLKSRCSAERNNTGMMRTDRGKMYRFGIKGHGDIICCHRRIHVEVECKKGKGGELSLDQQEAKDEVEENGGFYLIVHGLPELKVMWKELNLKIDELFHMEHEELWGD